MKLSYSQIRSALGAFERQGYLSVLSDPTFAKITLANYLLRHPVEKAQDLLANQYFFDSICVDQESAFEALKRGDIVLLAEELSTLTNKPIKSLRLDLIIPELCEHGCFGDATLVNLGYLKEKVSLALESLNKYGYTVVEDAIDRHTCEQTLAEVREIAEREVTDGTAYQYGNDLLLQRVYHLIFKSRLCQALLKNSLLLKILDQFFYRTTNHDLFYLSTFAANILHPGAQAQKLHVDENTCDPLVSWPIRIDANFILHDYSGDSGGTIVYPGTHKLLRKPTIEEQSKKEFLITGRRYYAKQIIAPAGSIALWTGKVWHKSGINQSGASRVALLACFCNSILREMSCEENNIRLLELKRRDSLDSSDDFISELIGYSHGIKDWSLLQNIPKF